MPKREVTEFDLRAPEFQRANVKPEDYEFRDDGKVVRKDRWETGLRNIASIIGWSRREYEIPEVVEEARRLVKASPITVEKELRDLRERARDVFYGDECPQAVRDAVEWYANSIDVILGRAATSGVMASHTDQSKDTK